MNLHLIKIMVLLEVNEVLEEVKISISHTNTWSNKKTFELYLDSENKEEGKEYVTLIGKDANNYKLSASADGNLDSTLYCHRVETTKVTGKLFDKKWGSFPVIFALMIKQSLQVESRIALQQRF